MAKNDGQGPATPPPGLAMLIGQLGKMGGGVGGGIGNIGGLFPGAGGPGIIGGSPNPPNMGGPGVSTSMPPGLSPGIMSDARRQQSEQAMQGIKEKFHQGGGILGGGLNGFAPFNPRTNMPTPGMPPSFGLPQGPVGTLPTNPGTIGGMQPTPQIPQNPMAPDMGRVTPNPGAGFTGMKRKREY